MRNAMLFIFRLVFVFAMGGFTLPVQAEEYYCYEAEEACKSECCNSEIYFGGIGLGSSRKTGDSVGLNFFFGDEEGRRRVNGFIYGALLGYTYRNPCGFYFNAELDWATGRLKGKDKDDEDFPNRNLNELITTFKVGYNFQFCSLLLTPYVGVGNWYENHRLNRNFKHHYCNWFGIVGGKADWTVNDYFTMGIDLEAFLPIHTNVKFRHVCRHAHLKNHWGGQIEFPLKLDAYRFFGCYDGLFLTLAPFYRFEEYGRSKFFTCETNTFRAPKLELHDYGAKLYAGFCF